MTEIMESKMLAALTGNKPALAPTEVITCEEMVAYIQKYTPLISVEHRKTIFRMVEKLSKTVAYSELPSGIAINMNRLSTEIIAQIYAFIKHVRLT
jgi:hypothetical protein